MQREPNVGLKPVRKLSAGAGTIFPLNRATNVAKAA